MSNRNNGQVGSFFTGFFVGGLVGAVIALLAAPRSGTETRRQIRAKGVELRDRAGYAADEALTTVKAATADVTSRVEELRVQLEEGRKNLTETVQEVKKVIAEAAEEITKTATEAIEETKNTAKAAVEETKKAAAEAVK